MVEFYILLKIIMLHTILRQVLRLTLLVLFLGQLGLSSSPASATEVQPPAASRQESVETVLPQAQKQAPEGKQATEKPTTTEGQVKQKTPSPKAKVAYPQPPNPYNRQAIEQFDKELYGD